MGKETGKPITTEMAFVGHLKELVKEFIEIGKQPVEVQETIYKSLISGYKKMSEEDQKTFRAILNIFIPPGKSFLEATKDRPIKGE